MKNIFLSGPPGCGKTSLILEVLKKRKDTKIIEVTKENRNEVLYRVIRELVRCST